MSMSEFIKAHKVATTATTLVVLAPLLQGCGGGSEPEHYVPADMTFTSPDGHKTVCDVTSGKLVNSGVGDGNHITFNSWDIPTVTSQDGKTSTSVTGHDCVVNVTGSQPYTTGDEKAFEVGGQIVAGIATGAAEGLFTGWAGKIFGLGSGGSGTSSAVGSAAANATGNVAGSFTSSQLAQLFSSTKTAGFTHAPARMRGPDGREGSYHVMRNDKTNEAYVQMGDRYFRMEKAPEGYQGRDLYSAGKNGEYRLRMTEVRDHQPGHQYNGGDEYRQPGRNKSDYDDQNIHQRGQQDNGGGDGYRQPGRNQSGYDDRDKMPPGYKMPVDYGKQPEKYPQSGPHGQIPPNNRYPNGNQGNYPQGGDDNCKGCIQLNSLDSPTFKLGMLAGQEVVVRFAPVMPKALVREIEYAPAVAA